MTYLMTIKLLVTKLEGRMERRLDSIEDMLHDLGAKRRPKTKTPVDGEANVMPCTSSWRNGILSPKPSEKVPMSETPSMTERIVLGEQKPEVTRQKVFANEAEVGAVPPAEVLKGSVNVDIEPTPLREIVALLDWQAQLEA